jgi:hypothetical protein
LVHHTPPKKQKKKRIFSRLLKIKVSIEIWSASPWTHLRTTLGKEYGLKVWCYLEHLGGKTLGTLCEFSMGTPWYLDGNTLGAQKIK